MANPFDQLEARIQTLEGLVAALYTSSPVGSDGGGEEQRCAGCGHVKPDGQECDVIGCECLCGMIQDLTAGTVQTPGGSENCPRCGYPPGFARRKADDQGGLPESAPAAEDEKPGESAEPDTRARPWLYGYTGTK